MKILITPRSFRKDGPAYEMLSRAGLEIVMNNSGGILSEEGLAQHIADCDGVILGVDPLTADVIGKAPRLKAIAKYGVGIDNIDQEACLARGIRISRTLGANADAVADYAFALMLSVARNIIPIDAKCRKKDWSKTTSIDVFGKTLGLIGLGAIGRGMAARAAGFGMRVLAHDVFWDDTAAKQAGISYAVPAQIYAKADFISLHVPLTDQTRGMIGAAEIAAMKPTAIIINTARGGIVDENALLDALQQGKIYGAGIDAFEEEPPSNPAWYGLANVVLGSHCAASTFGATEQMANMAAQNLLKDLE